MDMKKFSNNLGKDLDVWQLLISSNQGFCKVKKLRETAHKMLLKFIDTWGTDLGLFLKKLWDTSSPLFTTCLIKQTECRGPAAEYWSWVLLVLLTEFYWVRGNQEVILFITFPEADFLVIWNVIIILNSSP